MPLTLKTLSDENPAKGLDTSWLLICYYTRSNRNIQRLQSVLRTPCFVSQSVAVGDPYNFTNVLQSKIKDKFVLTSHHS